MMEHLDRNFLFLCCPNLTRDGVWYIYPMSKEQWGWKKLNSECSVMATILLRLSCRCWFVGLRNINASVTWSKIHKKRYLVKMSQKDFLDPLTRKQNQQRLCLKYCSPRNVFWNVQLRKIIVLLDTRPNADSGVAASQAFAINEWRVIDNESY